MYKIGINLSISLSLTYLRAATSLSEKRMRVTEGEGVSENAANSSICSCNFAPSTNKLSPALPLHTPSRPMLRHSPDSPSPVAIAMAMAMDHSHNKPTLYRRVIAEANSLPLCEFCGEQHRQPEMQIGELHS